MSGVARLLIMDDDEAFRDFLCAALEELGHSVLSAADGFEGMKLFRADPADLVLTDILMPGDGQAIIRQLHGEFPELGIIVMSGGPDYGLDVACAIGAHAALEKPFSLRSLEAAIERVLAEHPPLFPVAAAPFHQWNSAVTS
jgi:DNA-binding NtrC family response regulator